MVFAERLSLAHRAAQTRWAALSAPYPACTLFFSVSDGTARARVVHASGADFESAWRLGVAALQTSMTARRMTGRWLRVEWVVHAEPIDRPALDARLQGTKRNYFREGLAFDDGFRLALTEQELNGHAVLVGGSTVAHAQLNESNLATCAQSRFGKAWTGMPSQPWHTFRTAGVFVDASGLHTLADEGLAIGRRALTTVTPADVGRLVESSSAYLARQVDAQGRFVYGYFPCFDRAIPAYNTLRHASSVYAMTEAWAETRSPILGAAIVRALRYVERECVRFVDDDPDGRVAFLVDVGDEIKLGGNAVLILALTRHAAASGDKSGLALAQALARGIRRMQHAGTGRFTHVLNYPALTVKAEQRIIYYDGEAAFALMRLYDATRDATWLGMVEKAFEHFIAAEHWRAHDHWLSYCVNELTLHRPRRAYYEFGVRNIAGYLDFVANRITTFPTLLELMMAARAMLERLSADPDYADLYAQIDIAAFEQALERRAHRLLDGHFWPELAMAMRNPDRVVGSFFIRHHAFRVRIDDVEHYLSGFIAYQAHVRRGRPALPPAKAAAAAPVADIHTDVGGPGDAGALWTADSVAAATQGRWLRPPPADWQSEGVSLWAPAMRPGDMAVVRGAATVRGISQNAANRLDAAAWIVDDPCVLPADASVPVLLVSAVQDAVMAFAHTARRRLAAPVLAVTGSAGKTTTVAMLAQALAPFGEVGQTRHNANLPVGIAWNLASMPSRTRHIVLELAIGRMRENTRIARPDVAIFTNIAAAHLEYHHDLRTVASKKAAIFEGMAPGAAAIINQDMAEAEVVLAAARARALRVITYGTTDSADVRLRRYDADSRGVVADVAGTVVELTLAAPGEHLALNALAVLAAAHALGLPLSTVARAVETFQALPGRGQPLDVTVQGRAITVIDDSYNANPASMAAALAIARDHPSAAKLLVLGDMLELGADTRRFHGELDAAVRAVGARKVVLCGPLMQALQERLPDEDVAWYPDADAVIAHLPQHLGDVDYVLVKSSGGTRLSAVVGALRAPGSPAPGVDQNRTVSPA